jgi:serine/threonine protein kinase
MQLWSSEQSTAVPDSWIGQRVGAWVIVQQLHEGDWSRLFAAQPFDAAGSSRVDYVLKVARRDTARAALAAASVQREAVVGGAVHHPNLIAVLDSGTIDQQSYVAMPRLDGANLARTLALHAIQAVPVALWWTRQLASAMAAMHAAGWCHGNIKPAHVMVGLRGHLTLFDLGNARAINSVCSGIRPAIAFAAPETLQEQAVAQAASDIYSLGLVLHQMLTGWDPLEIEPAALAADRRVGKHPPKPAGGASAPPQAVERLLEAMLELRPEHRPSASEVCQSLLAVETKSLSDFINPARAA